MSRRNNLKSKYGISLEYYDSIKKFQKNRCAICKQPESVIGKLVVDHNHKTGQVRGLLCSRCNLGIGFFKESVKRLIRAVIYLNSWQNLTQLKEYVTNVLSISDVDVLHIVGEARDTTLSKKSDVLPLTDDAGSNPR